MDFSTILMWFFSVAIFLLGSVSDSYVVHFRERISLKLHPAANKKNVELDTKQDTKLNMTVFYESLCGGYELFFQNQFSGNWLQFYDYLNVSLIPYGKATQTQDKEGNWSFECQHGEEECYFNRIQVCAISRLIEDRQKKLFTFISCFESHDDKESAGSKCADLINYPYEKLEKCAKSKEGFDLLATFGDMTHNFRPKLKWVPTVVFNNKFNQTESVLAVSDLKSLLCEKLDRKPNVCI